MCSRYEVNVDGAAGEQQSVAKDRWSGRELISAGEVGQFVFCPEAWRIRRMTGEDGEPSDRSELGKIEHNEWGSVVDQLEAVRLGLRVLCGLCIAAFAVLEWGIGR